MSPATATRPGAARMASTQAKGQTLWSGQQVSANIKLDIIGAGQVQVLYQPFGSDEWKTMDLDPVVQFAIYSHAMERGEVTQSLVQSNNTATPQQRSAATRSARARSRVSVNRATAPTSAATP